MERKTSVTAWRAMNYAFLLWQASQSAERCIMNFRGRAAFSISDANIQKTATRLQAIGKFLTFQHSTKMSVSEIKNHCMFFMLSLDVFHKEERMQ